MYSWVESTKVGWPTAKPIVVVFEARRIKGVTSESFRAAKLLVIRVWSEKISTLMLIAYIAIPSCRGSNA